MLLFHFLEYEQDRIADLKDTEQSSLSYLEHYKQLSPEEAAIAGYMLIAAGKGYVGYYGEIVYPFDCVAQENVNNGFGKMYNINPHCFPFPQEVTLFYVRSDMWISEHRRKKPIPEWIEDMAHDIRLFSSGLADIKTEIIQISFNEDPPCDYYAITFRLDKNAVKEKIELAGEVFYMEELGSYILTLTDITGEYEANYGELIEGTPVVLERESIDFK